MSQTNKLHILFHKQAVFKEKYENGEKVLLVFKSSHQCWRQRSLFYSKSRGEKYIHFTSQVKTEKRGLIHSKNQGVQFSCNMPSPHPPLEDNNLSSYNTNVWFTSHDPLSCIQSTMYTLDNNLLCNKKFLY